jgi:hypothetical protein
MPDGKPALTGISVSCRTPRHRIRGLVGIISPVAHGHGNGGFEHLVLIERQHGAEPPRPDAKHLVALLQPGNRDFPGLASSGA